MSRRSRPIRLDFLGDTLKKRWRTFRRRVRKGLPRGLRGVGEAVHDLRTGSRRLLVILSAAEQVGRRKAIRRVERRVQRVLDRLGPLSDLTVVRQMAARLEAGAHSATLRRFRRAVEEDRRRSARQARRWLDRNGRSAPKGDRRRIVERLAEPRSREDAAAERQRLLEHLRTSFEELRARRAAVDPLQADTVHRMRIGLKGFRYLAETLAPLLPRAPARAIASLDSLQTTMGELHDLEVLSSALVRFAKDDPERTAELSGVLADLEAAHSRMLQSFLETADPLLERWRGLLEIRSPLS